MGSFETEVSFWQRNNLEMYMTLINQSSSYTTVEKMKSMKKKKEKK